MLEVLLAHAVHPNIPLWMKFLQKPTFWGPMDVASIWWGGVLWSRESPRSPATALLLAEIMGNNECLYQKIMKTHEFSQNFEFYDN